MSKHLSHSLGSSELQNGTTVTHNPNGVVTLSGGTLHGTIPHFGWFQCCVVQIQCSMFLHSKLIYLCLKIGVWKLVLTVSPPRYCLIWTLFILIGEVISAARMWIWTVGNCYDPSKRKTTEWEEILNFNTIHNQTLHKHIYFKYPLQRLCMCCSFYTFILSVIFFFLSLSLTQFHFFN